MYSKKEKEFHSEVEDILASLYILHKESIVEHPKSTFYVHYYENVLKGKKGSKIIFDLRSEEANFINYPSRYQKYIPDFETLNSSVQREWDMIAVKTLVDIFRTVERLRKEIIEEN